MRKLPIAAVLALLPSLSFAGWASGGLLSSPAANAILADTGPLPPQSINLTMFCSCSVTCIVVLEHRDATNTGNVSESGGTHAQGFFISANTGAVYPFPQAITLDDLQRVRVRLQATITGSAWCSITY